MVLGGFKPRIALSGSPGRVVDVRLERGRGGRQFLLTVWPNPTRCRVVGPRTVDRSRRQGEKHETAGSCSLLGMPYPEKKERRPQPEGWGLEGALLQCRAYKRFESGTGVERPWPGTGDCHAWRPSAGRRCSCKAIDQAAALQRVATRLKVYVCHARCVDVTSQSRRML